MFATVCDSLVNCTRQECNCVRETVRNVSEILQTSWGAFKVSIHTFARDTWLLREFFDPSPFLASARVSRAGPALHRRKCIPRMGPRHAVVLRCGRQKYSFTASWITR